MLKVGYSCTAWQCRVPPCLLAKKALATVSARRMQRILFLQFCTARNGRGTAGSSFFITNGLEGSPTKQPSRASLNSCLGGADCPSTSRLHPSMRRSRLETQKVTKLGDGSLFWSEGSTQALACHLHALTREGKENMGRSWTTSAQRSTRHSPANCWPRPAPRRTHCPAAATPCAPSRTCGGPRGPPATLPPWCRTRPWTLWPGTGPYPSGAAAHASPLHVVRTRQRFVEIWLHRRGSLGKGTDS